MVKLLCTKCWNGIDTCQCLQNSHKALYVTIDELIANTISNLNKKGIETGYCCSGHPEEDLIQAHIIFKKHYDFDILPPEIIDGAHLKYGGGMIEYLLIPKMLKGKTFEDKVKIVEDINKQLEEWSANVKVLKNKKNKNKC